jgi:hypothetical protein
MVKEVFETGTGRYGSALLMLSLIAITSMERERNEIIF